MSNRRSIHGEPHPVCFAVGCRPCLWKLSWSRICCVFAAGLLLLCGSCQTTSEPLANQPHGARRVTLSPGDKIKLTFPGATELNQTQQIRADGKVSLSIIGEITAAGKTLPDFQKELAALYKPQLRNSEVVVILESGLETVIVSGFVHKPAKFSFDRPTTAFQAIMEAGGVTEYGSLSNIHLIRVINGKQHTQILNLKSAMSGKSTEAQYVQDGDIIYVAHTIF